MQRRTWSTTVEVDPETGDYILTFPPDLLEQVGWREGDVVEFEVVQGAIAIRKVQ